MENETIGDVILVGVATNQRGVKKIQLMGVGRG
jgi:hypothetical protein